MRNTDSSHSAIVCSFINMRGQEKKKYYLLQQKEIEEIKALEKKPSLLMHTCCAVCACYPALYLSEYFDLTLFYNNDNIYPYSEYERRYNELMRLIEEYNAEHSTNINVIKTDYKGAQYLKRLEPLKDEPEKGKRCILCYTLRMEEAMQYASQHNFDYFTTVMTISRQKDSIAMNTIGEVLEKKYPNVRYFYSDFKKDGGLEKGNSIANEKGLYRQQYCGCYYSYKQYLERIGENNNNMLKELALKYSNLDYNCAESILHAANQQYDLGLTDKEMKLVGGFGAGMQVGDICGSLAAGICVISERYIEVRAHEDRPRLRHLVSTYIREFQNEMGSRLCKEIKPQFYTPELKCQVTIGKAADILEKVIKKLDEEIKCKENT